MFAKFSQFKQNKSNAFDDRSWSTPSEECFISDLKHQQIGSYENIVTF